MELFLLLTFISQVRRQNGVGRCYSSNQLATSQGIHLGYRRTTHGRQRLVPEPLSVCLRCISIHAARVRGMD